MLSAGKTHTVRRSSIQRSKTRLGVAASHPWERTLHREALSSHQAAAINRAKKKNKARRRARKPNRALLHLFLPAQKLPTTPNKSEILSLRGAVMKAALRLPLGGRDWKHQNQYLGKLAQRLQMQQKMNIVNEHATCNCEMKLQTDMDPVHSSEFSLRNKNSKPRPSDTPTYPCEGMGLLQTPTS